MRRDQLGHTGRPRHGGVRAAAVAIVLATAAGACGGGPERADAMRPSEGGGAGTPTTTEPSPGAGGGGTTIIEDTDIGTEAGTVEYTGESWTRCGGCDIPTEDESYYYGYEAGQSYTIRFTGERIEVLAPDDRHGGAASVTVDGAPAATAAVGFNAEDPDNRSTAVRWDSGPLPAGDHEVTFTIQAGDDQAGEPGTEGNEVVLFDQAIVHAAGGAAPEPTPVPEAPEPDPAPAPEDPAPDEPAPGPAPGGNAPALLGAGVEDPYEFAGWLGRPVDIWETWQPQTTWADMIGVPTLHAYFTGEAGAPFDRRWEGQVSFGQPMWAVGDDAATCASGANDADMRAVAQAVLDAGFPDTWWRLGWEMDGSWFGATNGAWEDPEGWVACWRRWHDILAEVSPGFRTVWNPNFSSNTGAGPFDVRTVWPGDEYVDAAGPDYYDWDLDPNGTGDGGAPVGINQWVQFVVEEHNTPFVLPEWGLNAPNGGGDDAAFVHEVFDVLDDLKSRGMLAYASYFSLQGCTFQVHVGGCNPASTEAYRQRAGAF